VYFCINFVESEFKMNEVKSMTKECKVTKKPRKYAELIKAWADGAEIQVRPSSFGNWADCENPYWADHYEYRIKPQPKPDKVEFAFVKHCDSTSTFYWYISGCDNRNLKFIFDGETGKLKSAEVLK
jgi:hypothetical protein